MIITIKSIIGISEENKGVSGKEMPVKAAVIWLILITIK